MLALASAAAHAEPANEPPPKLAILVGPGLRKAWLHNDDVYPASHDQTLGALTATIAYRVSSHVALGVHAGAARSSDQLQEDGNTSSQSQSWNVAAVDLAIAVQYEEDRFTLTPWLGRHFSRFHEDDTQCSHPPRQVESCRSSHVTEWTSDFASYGLTASVMLARNMPIAVFVDLQTGTGGAVLGPQGQPGFHYSAATFGVAYRR
jgi:hypothetical protein